MTLTRKPHQVLIDSDEREYGRDVRQAWPRAITKSFATLAGRLYLSLIGTTGAGAVELMTQQADATGVQVGQVQWTDKNSASAFPDQIIAMISAKLSGATANNRGGEMEIYTKANNSTLNLTVIIDNAGNVGIGGAAADASAQLAVNSVTKGFLPPRMTEAQRDAISSPAAGLLVYNTTTNKLNLRVAAAWEVITSV